MQPCRMKRVPKSVCTFGEPGKMGRAKRSQQVAKRNGRQSDHTEQPASIEIMEKTSTQRHRAPVAFRQPDPVGEGTFFASVDVASVVQEIREGLLRRPLLVS